ncbi:MAG: hypothetical protein IPI29_14430 [Ignavibacteria bacterium]|nr:hypothetical protein [Ignavibacteria bacterium]
MIAQNRSRLLWLLSACVGLHLLAACASTPPEKEPEKPKRKITRSSGILGLAVNTSADDFAAVYLGQRSDSAFFFTSNIDGRERIYRTSTSAIWLDDASATNPISPASIPPALVQNSGTVTRPDPANASTTVFAVSAAVQGELSKILNIPGTIHGGSDLFEQRDSAMVKSIDEVNSSAWEAHPAVATYNDVEIMVFSSDRSTAVGYSAPYSNAKYTTRSGDTISGNADLWLTFRRRGDSVWSAPRNLAAFDGKNTINSGSNEYSPFLYCVESTPHLLFASNRAGSYDIYDARLDISWEQQSVLVKRVVKLPLGAGEVNTIHTELFPYVSYPHIRTSKRDLFVSSDRFIKEKAEDALEAGYGGLDVYSVNTVLSCGFDSVAAPVGSLTYDVVLLDRSTRDTTIKQGRTFVSINGRTEVDSICSAFRIHLPADSLKGLSEIRIVSKGSSGYSARPCKELGPILTQYSRRAITAKEKVRARKVQIAFDSVKPPDTIKQWKNIVVFDTLASGEALDLSKYKGQDPKIVPLNRDRVRIEYRKLAYVDSILAPKTFRATRSSIVYDTVSAFDTVYISSIDSPATSQLSENADLRIPIPQRDTVIFDTIYLEPRYEQAPPCVEIFESKDSTRNVPYFQTAFWEVNTSAGYAQHLERLRKGNLRNARWVELNWENTYWGGNDPENVTQRLKNRREEYREKAELVDRNIDSLSRRTSQLLAKFWKADSANPDAKFMISMVAFSDKRPIELGYYCADTSIAFVSTSFDTNANVIQPAYHVRVAPNASLIGESNDTLSKLRAYFGYQAVWEHLEQDSLMRALRSRGLVLTPTDVHDPAEYDRRIRTARVVILAEGRSYDSKVIAKQLGYGDGKDDFYQYDWVRRVDIQIRRINFKGDRWEKPECCK